MLQQKNNFAFIDCTNVYLGVKALGWNLDFRRFKKYLMEKYGAQKAYLFLGYNPTNADMYKKFQEYGYILIFKPILELKDGRIKGNCDAELVLQSMIDLPNYDKAIIVSGDGDFCCLVQYLMKVNKLEHAIAPSQENCSSLLKKVVGSEITFLSDLKQKLQYKKFR